MVCKHCGEDMEGDGVSTAIHCPNSEVHNWEFNEPDCDPVDCKAEDYIYE
ncbi:MAG: hypothetical protein [Bacteriophage sp.]|nr:MAG: hypothetical protein [Bacteriophage sp.]